jgi:hypothetical protein
MNVPTSRSRLATDQEIKNARQVELELAREVRDYFNRNIQLTRELSIPGTEGIGPLRVPIQFAPAAEKLETLLTVKKL